MVWFSGIGADGSYQAGNMQVIGAKGSFFNEEIVFGYITEGFKVDKPFIKSFYEFKSKEDFEFYVRKTDKNTPNFNFES